MFIALGEFTTTFSFEKLIGFHQNKIVINIPQILILTICTAWFIRLLSWFIWALTEVKCLKKFSAFCISSTFLIFLFLYFYTKLFIVFKYFQKIVAITFLKSIFHTCVLYNSCLLCKFYFLIYDITI